MRILAVLLGTLLLLGGLVVAGHGLSRIIYVDTDPSTGAQFSQELTRGQAESIAGGAVLLGGCVLLGAATVAGSRRREQPTWNSPTATGAGPGGGGPSGGGPTPWGQQG